MTRLTNKNAQSILELALFGSILLLILGAILNYGLRYNQQQKVMMNTFRKCLETSTSPAAGGMASYAVLNDKHIPDASNPFGVGSVMPFNSSSSVIASYTLHQTPDSWEELPKVTMEIQGRQYTYRTAGFRYVPNDSGLSRYQEVYGSTNAWNSGGTYVLIDSCEGEVMDYDACKRQCRMITNVDFCIRECQRGTEPGISKDCSGICNQTIEIPWYCDRLDNIFAFATAQNKPKAMNVQGDYTQHTVVRNSLRKQEAAGTVNTTDTINWATTTDRTIVYIDSAHNVHQDPVTTTVGENQVLHNGNP